MEDLDDWEQVLKARYPPGAPTVPGADAPAHEFRDYRAEARPGVTRVLPPQPPPPDARLRPGEEARSTSRSDQRGDGHLGGDGVPQHAGRRQRPGHRPVARSSTCCRRPRRSARDGHPRWFILTGLIHDLGKILCLFGEPQWAVVGDTFPVGCASPTRIVFPEFFADNPDCRVPEYQTPCGIYEEGCGLDHVHLSWGHDEYLYHVVKDYLPERGAVHDPLPLVLRRATARGHTAHLMNDRDRRAVRRGCAPFNPYDLYSKAARAARRGGAAALLRGPDRRVLPAPARVVRLVFGSRALKRPEHLSRVFIVTSQPGRL